MLKKNITIKDVAKAANVSVTTVSRVINKNHEGVGKDTRQRVMDVVKELNFVPNAMARGLHSASTKTIELVIQDIANPYYPGIVLGVENAAQKRGYSVFLANVQRSHSRTKQYFELMREKRVDGMILVGGGIVRDADRERLFAGGGMRTVVIGKPAVECVSVQVDNVAAAKMACAHLLEAGHRRVGMITGAAHSYSARDREAGYEAALAEYGVEKRREWVARGNFTYEGGHAAAGKMPVGGENGVTAVFAHNDLMALGAVNGFLDRGLRVPEDVGVVGFDDIQLSSYVSPALTTVRVPFVRMGKAAVDCLAGLLAGRRVERTVILPAELVRRGTVRALSQDTER